MKYYNLKLFPLVIPNEKKKTILINVIYDINDNSTTISSKNPMNID
jgi:hypothetical protein